MVCVWQALHRSELETPGQELFVVRYATRQLEPLYIGDYVIPPPVQLRMPPDPASVSLVNCWCQH